MELEHLSVHFGRDRVELLDKDHVGEKVCAKWSKCYQLVDTLRKDSTYKYILVTQKTCESEQEITLVKSFDRKQFKKKYKWKKWCCLDYVKLVACFKLSQINELCDKIEMYGKINLQYKVTRIFENNFVFILLNDNLVFYVLDKSSKLEVKITSIYWYWMYCLLNRLEIGIEDTTQIFPLGSDNTNQKIILKMKDCTNLSLLSYSFVNKTVTKIKICSTRAEVNRLRAFLVEQIVLMTPHNFLGKETNFWFKVSNESNMFKCGYWCKDCKKTPNKTPEDKMSFLLMDVF